MGGQQGNGHQRKLTGDLATNNGGLGIRDPVPAAATLYIATQSRVRPKIEELLEESLRQEWSEDPAFINIINDVRTYLIHTEKVPARQIPFGPEPRNTPVKSKMLMESVHKKRKTDVMGGLDLYPRARLVQQTAQGSAAWLTEPFDEFGGTTEDKVFETMIRMRLLMNSPGKDKAPTAGMQHCCASKGIFQARICGHALDDKGKHDMICGTGGFTESRHNRVRDWLANKTRELEGATVSLEREVFPPFVKQKGRMDLIFKDARNPEHAFIDVVMATGWAPNDREADRQMEDPLRN